MEEAKKIVEDEKEEEKIEGLEIKQEPIKGNMLDISSPKVSGILPCGYLDGKGVVHRDYIVREIQGEEEDLFAAKGPWVPRFNRIIANCLESLGSLEKKSFFKAACSLTSTDKYLLLIQIRRASLGDFYDVKIGCKNKLSNGSECGNVINASLNLSKLKITGMRNPEKRKFEDTLRDGRVVKWHVMGPSDEDFIIKNRKKGEDVLTNALLARVDAIDDFIVNRDENLIESKKFLKGLSGRARREIRKLFVGKEGEVDTTVEFYCPECGYEWKNELDVASREFFFPLEE